MNRVVSRDQRTHRPDDPNDLHRAHPAFEIRIREIHQNRPPSDEKRKVKWCPNFSTASGSERVGRPPSSPKDEEKNKMQTEANRSRPQLAALGVALISLCVLGSLPRLGVASAASGWYARTVDFHRRLHTHSVADS